LNYSNEVIDKKLNKRDWLSDSRINFSPNSDKLNLVHKMTGVDLVREKFGLTGKNIKIGVIDTGKVS